MKVCSFLPAATNIIYQMKLEKFLYGVTFDCSSDKPKVVRSHLEDRDYTSREINRMVSESAHEGKSLYYVDEELLQQIAPDIIFTQDVCDVCQIDTSHVQRTIYKLNKQPQVIPLNPKNLNHVYDNVITIAKTLGQEQAAYHLLAQLKTRTDRIIDTLRKNNLPLKRVMFIEWLDPIYNCGHWIPYQIAQAGGIDMLSNPSGYSVSTSWEKILKYNPEVLIVAPCGFNINRTASEIHKLSTLKGWNDLQAIKDNSVFIVDSNLFTCPSTQLVDGIELLASLFHSDLFPKPEDSKHKYLSFNDIKIKYGKL